MIKIRCQAPHVTRLNELEPFQGKLKKRTKKDLEDLWRSLCEDGLLMPFAVWIKKDKKVLLDGHGRREALLKYDPETQQQFPCLIVEAAGEDEARKALVQIVSTYGRISKPGVIEFAAPISGYKAPIIKAPSVSKGISVAARKVPDADRDYEIIRIKVPKALAGSLKAFIQTLEGAEAL